MAEAPNPSLNARRSALAGLALALLLLAGCGNSRTAVVRLTDPLAPDGFQRLSFPADGLRLSVPRDWTVAQGRGRLLIAVTSGTAVAAVWRFPRAAPQPVTAADLLRAERELVAQARRIDPRLRLVSSSAVRLDGRPAVELDVVGHIGGQLRRIRSTHVFIAAAEVVLDEYAPVAVFHAVDDAVFSPLRRSLAFSASSA